MKLEEFAARGVAATKAVEKVMASYDLGRGVKGVQAVQAPLLAEERELFELESCVRRAVDSQVEAAKALARIRDRRLYRAEFKTLADFFLVRRNLEEGQPEYDLDSSQPATVVLPENERVARRLAALAPEKQRQVWKEAVKVAPNGQVTAKHVDDVMVRKNLASKSPVAANAQADLSLGQRPHSILRATERAVIALRACQDFFKRSDAEHYWLETAVENVQCVEESVKSDKSKKDEAEDDFVICREPSKGGIGVAAKPRYRTASGGWTNDPALAKRYPDRVAAAAGDRYGKPMSLEKALRRFKLKL